MSDATAIVTMLKAAFNAAFNTAFDISFDKQTIAFYQLGATMRKLYARDALDLRANARSRTGLSPTASASVHCFPLNEHKTETAR